VCATVLSVILCNFGTPFMLWHPLKKFHWGAMAPRPPPASMPLNISQCNVLKYMHFNTCFTRSLYIKSLDCLSNLYQCPFLKRDLTKLDFYSCPYVSNQKPKNCPSHNFEIGGNYVPKPKKAKLLHPECVLVGK
jgi:hypothetical protein